LVTRVKMVVVKSNKSVRGFYQFNTVMVYVMIVTVTIMATDSMLFIKC
jgi:hypothetical protein